MRIPSSRARVLSASATVAAVIGASACSSDREENIDRAHQAAATAKYDWLQFGGDSRHGGNNTLEKQIAPGNVATLKQLFKIPLPETVEGAPVVLTDVTTSSGVHDVAF